MKKRSPFDAKELLKIHGLRATPIRVSLLQVLRDSEQPLSVEDLLTAVTPLIEGCDVVTVYRNMNQFSEIGIVHPIDLGTDKKLYEFMGSNPHHHHHVVCTKCQRIEHLDICGIEIHVKMIQSLGYRDVGHKLEFSGVCRRCA